jgi:hypothetical protein
MPPGIIGRAMKSVYFFLRQYNSPEDAGYQHRSIALAEGLIETGVKVFSNIDYWRLSPHSEQTLFKNDPEVEPEDCDAVVAEHVYFDSHRHLPSCFGNRGRKYRTVYLDASDGWRTASLGDEFHIVDLILKCHCNRRFHYGDNVRPWAFGLSGRIVQALESPVPYSRRKRTIVCNPRYAHPVRKAANKRFLPLLDASFRVDDTADQEKPRSAEDALLWQQSGRRHYPAYYARLSESAACGAFGGYFVPSFSRSLNFPLLRLANRVVFKTGLMTHAIAQFDNWRFWESLAAGCLTFHVDLEHYHCALPVAPENGTHYYGINLGAPEQEVRRVMQSESAFGEVAARGREWVLQHYTPVATARRFVQYLS